MNAGQKISAFCFGVRCWLCAVGIIIAVDIYDNCQMGQMDFGFSVNCWNVPLNANRTDNAHAVRTIDWELELECVRVYDLDVFMFSLYSLKIHMNGE